MSYRMRLAGLVAAIGLLGGSELLACGDKFLGGGRGTRYQRPKNARAASVLIYADPASGAAIRSVPLDSMLKRQGHRFAIVETYEQLSALLAGDRFDVVLAASNAVAAVERLLVSGGDAPVVVAFCVKGQKAPAKSAHCDLKAPPKERSLLEAIDDAVERHDKKARKTQARG